MQWDLASRLVMSIVIPMRSILFRFHGKVLNVNDVLLQTPTTLLHNYYIYAPYYAMVTHGRVLINKKGLLFGEYESENTLKELILHANFW